MQLYRHFWRPLVIVLHKYRKGCDAVAGSDVAEDVFRRPSLVFTLRDKHDSTMVYDASSLWGERRGRIRRLDLSARFDGPSEASPIGHLRDARVLRRTGVEGSGRKILSRASLRTARASAKVSEI